MGRRIFTQQKEPQRIKGSEEMYQTYKYLAQCFPAFELFP